MWRFSHTHTRTLDNGPGNFSAHPPACLDRSWHQGLSGADLGDAGTLLPRPPSAPDREMHTPVSNQHGSPHHTTQITAVPGAIRRTGPRGRRRTPVSRESGPQPVSVSAQSFSAPASPGLCSPSTATVSPISAFPVPGPRIRNHARLVRDLELQNSANAVAARVRCGGN